MPEEKNRDIGKKESSAAGSQLSASCKFGVASGKSGGSNGQQRNVGKGIQVFNRMPIAHPKPFLGSSLESGIVPFTFRSERKNGFEFQRISLNGKPVVVWNCHIFCAAGGLSGQPPFGVFFAIELYQIELLSAFYIF